MREKGKCRSKVQTSSSKPASPGPANSSATVADGTASRAQGGKRADRKCSRRRAGCGHTRRGCVDRPCRGGHTVSHVKYSWQGWENRRGRGRTLAVRASRRPRPGTGRSTRKGGPRGIRGCRAASLRAQRRLPAGRVRPSPRSDGWAGPTALSAASRWDASISVSPRAPCLPPAYTPLHRRPAFPSPLSTREVGSRRISPLPPTGIPPRHLRAPGRTSCLFA